MQKHRVPRRAQAILAVSAVALFLIVMFVASQAKPILPVIRDGAQPTKNEFQDEPAFNSRTPPNIRAVDEIQSITTDATALAGWEAYKDTAYGVQLAYPTEWTLAADYSAPHSGPDSGKTYNIVFKKGIHVQRCCTLQIEQKNFETAINAFEANDDEDDGKVTSDPYQAFSDIKEKDEFLFNGMQAVRFKVFNRLSNEPSGIYRYDYFIKGNDDLLYFYSTVILTPEDEALGEKILRHIVLQS
ncbi:hypothetical protein JNJ66_07475 [Candidatus Saccharibacteria bacterium]|nr:hypothetical protein [Candidatus Saccharibacteria bacterium]